MTIKLGGDLKNIYLGTQEVKAVYKGSEKIRPFGRPVISSFSYTNKTLSYSRQVNAIVFNTDGTKLYLTGEGDNTVYQYSLSTPYDLSTASYANKSKSLSSQSGVVESLNFTNDGTKMIMGGSWNQGYLYEYTLSTARDISTATYTNKRSSSSYYEITSYKIYNNGTLLFLASRGNKNIQKYNLSTARDISTISTVQQTKSLSSFRIHEVVFNPKGTQMFVFDRNTRKIHIYSLSTARDLNTATETGEYTVPTPSDTNICAMTIDNKGKAMFVGGYAQSAVYQYNAS